MQDWIAGSFAVLGTLMVLAGATLIVLRTLGRLRLPGTETAPPGGTPPGGTATFGGTHAAAENEPPPGRRLMLRRLSPPTQLIGWGILLLVVAAFAVELLGFGICFDAGTGNATGTC